MSYKGREKEYKREYSREWRRKNREKSRKDSRERMRKIRGSPTHCAVCGSPLPEGKRKYRKFCSEKCQKERLRESARKGTKKYAKAHPDRVNRYKREQRMKIKLKVLRHYGGEHPKCACCGESHMEFLTLDHMHGDGAKHRREIGLNVRRGGLRYYRWLIKNNFPEEIKLQVLCLNCNHAKKTYNKRFCPVHHPELYKI